MEEGWEPLPIGCGEVLRTGDDLLILAYGSMVNPALATAELLERSGQSATVVNARFLRPLDESLIHPLCQRINRVVTMEEGALAGGFGAAVLESLSDQAIDVAMLRLGIPDQLVDHATPQQSLEALGLTPAQMAVRIQERFSFGVASAMKNTAPLGMAST